MPSARSSSTSCFCPRGLEAALLQHPLRDPQVLGLADPRPEEDGVHLGDGREQRALPAPDEVAGLDLGRAHEAVDRRRDPRVAEVERRLVGRRLHGVHLGAGRVLGGQRVVELLLADRLLLHEGRQAGHVGVRLGELGLGRGQVRLRVGEGGLQGQRVDQVEERALAHERALGEGHLLEVPLDAGPDLDVLGAPRLADELQVDGDVLLDDVSHVDLGRSAGGGFLLAAPGRQGRHEAAQGQDQGTFHGVGLLEKQAGANHMPAPRRRHRGQILNLCPARARVINSRSDPSGSQGLTPRRRSMLRHGRRGEVTGA